MRVLAADVRLRVRRRWGLPVFRVSLMRGVGSCTPRSALATEPGATPRLRCAVAGVEGLRLATWRARWARLCVALMCARGGWVQRRSSVCRARVRRTGLLGSLRPRCPERLCGGWQVRRGCFYPQRSSIERISPSIQLTSRSSCLCVPSVDGFSLAPTSFPSVTARALPPSFFSLDIPH